MCRNNVRVIGKFLYRFIKKVKGNKVVDRSVKLRMYTKGFIEQQSLKEKYIKLMNDAERAVGRKEAIYLLREAEVVWHKINS